MIADDAARHCIGHYIYPIILCSEEGGTTQALPGTRYNKARFNAIGCALKNSLAHSRLHAPVRYAADAEGPWPSLTAGVD